VTPVSLVCRLLSRTALSSEGMSKVQPLVWRDTGHSRSWLPAFSFSFVTLGFELVRQVLCCLSLTFQPFWF
jgi:hypothetical protein